MKRFLTALLFLMPAIAFAQTPEVVQKVDAKLQVERDAQRQEDVEILRRLLNRGFGLPNELKLEMPIVAYQTTTALPELQGYRSRTQLDAPLGPFDALSLPEVGLIYTLHIPSGAEMTFHEPSKSLGLDSSCKACHRIETGPGMQAHASMPSDCSKCHTLNTVVAEGKPATDWDKLKAEIRGEKPVEKVKPKADRTNLCEYGRIENALLSLLFANAKNVRQLDPKESIRIAVTLDSISTSKVGSSWKYFNYYDPDSGQMKHMAEPSGSTKDQTPGGAKGDSPPANKPGLTPAESQKLTLADLHLKAGKYQQAAEAYCDVLARFSEKTYRIDSLGKIAPDQRVKLTEEFQKGIRDAMANCAKALLLNNEPEKAKFALEMATEFVVLEVAPTKSTPSPIGPAKLIVTVTKADLDSAKTFAEFKKTAKVERQNWMK